MDRKAIRALPCDIGLNKKLVALKGSPDGHALLCWVRMFVSDNVPLKAPASRYLRSKSEALGLPLEDGGVRRGFVRLPVRWEVV